MYLKSDTSQSLEESVQVKIVELQPIELHILPLGDRYFQWDRDSTMK